MLLDKIALRAMREHGLQFGIFDRRVLLPMDQLISSVRAETGEVVSAEDLRKTANDGLIPLSDAGAPLYVPSRVGFLVQLERQGYNTAELRDIADDEETLITELLTTEQLAYIDDDLDFLINYCTEIIKQGFHVTTEECRASAAKRENYERYLVTLRRYRTMGLPENCKDSIAEVAFNHRAHSEAIRVMLLDQDRARLRAGYSPAVCALASRYDCKEDSPGLFEATVERIHWEWTIQGALARDEARAPRIRVPGFLLEGERVTPIETLTPNKYKALWEQHDLDGYLQAWSKINGERRCLNCFTILDTSGSPTRRYCGVRCRNAAKQRRFRKGNPVAYYENQRKYWTSLDE